MVLSAVRLEGARIVVRSTEADDAARIISYHERNRAHLAPWEPAPPPAFYTEAFWREKLREHAEDRARGTGNRFCIFEKPDKDAIAGMIGLFEIIPRAPVWRGRVGYSIDAKKEGRGLMSEALALVVRYAFDELNLKRVHAGYIPHNARSAKVLERAGFEREGYCREYFFVGGKWHDHVDTSLINAAWKLPPDA